MIYKTFAVYDSKADAFMLPFNEKATGLAVRAFEQAANNPESQFHKFPLDFTLMEIGTFDDTTGEITNNPTHINLGLAANHMNTEHNQ